MKKLIAILTILALLSCSIPAFAGAGWVCPKCGKEMPATAKFCPNDRSERPAADNSWACSNCGQTGNTGKFCPNCAAPKGGSASVVQGAQALPTRKTNEDGSFIDYSYNEANQLTSETTYAFSDAMIQTVEYSYNGNNQLVASETRLYAEDGSFKSHYVSAYDSTGNEVERTYYYENGKIYSRSDYQYDTSGTRTRQESYSWLLDGSFYSYEIIEYNNAGKEAKKTYYDQNGNTRGCQVYQCNTSGTKTHSEVELRKQDGSFNARYVIEYDGAGNAAKSTSYYENGKIRSRIDNQYNDSGTWTCSECYSWEQDGSFSSHQVIEFDSNGKWATMTHYYENGKIDSRYDRQYNASGTMTRQEFHYWKQDGSFQSRGVSEYDSNGKKTKETSYYESGKTCYRYDYQYNASGTMTRQECYAWNPDGSFIYHWVSEYDSNGQETKRTYYDANGNIMK